MGVLAVSASQRALAVRGKERERGEMIKRIEGCNARLERGPDHLRSQFGFLLQLMHNVGSSPQHGLHICFYKVLYNEMEMNHLANTRLRFKCLEI